MWPPLDSTSMQVPPIRVVPANKGAGELPIAGLI